ncbi:MAG: acyltransferase family protein [Hyphomonadaceae bacterium]|nr:acyltransferase family protein [Hyphomonadaceae bacterium]
MDRRFDLDWLRIAAFGLLIFYHVGMFYVTWDWHVKSPHASDAIEPLMLLTNPWRLELLFLISGVATRFMADKMPVGRFFGSRAWRLLPPLIFAIFVIVPPQSYFEIVEQIGYAGSFADFYPKYVTASGHWCDADGCLVTPTYNHMWFVAYLFLYTLVLLPLLPLLRRVPARPLARLIAGPGLLVTPIFFLWMARGFLRPIFEPTNALVDDWYQHVIYFGGFVFGYAIAKHQPFFDGCVRLRWVALALAIPAWLGLIWINGLFDDGEGPPALMLFILRVTPCIQAWCAIVALIGFAHKHLKNADGPVRRYLTLGIFPFYLVHQTIIVVAGHDLARLAWPVWLEASSLILLTAGGCFLAYEIARRAGPLRPLFGLRAGEKAVEVGRGKPHVSVGA